MVKTEKIKDLMYLSRITQEEMAKRLGMCRATLIKKIHNQRRFTLTEIIDMCHILKTKPKEIVEC